MTTPTSITTINKLSNEQKRHAWDFIMVNVCNDKLSDAEFRGILKHTWTSTFIFMTKELIGDDDDQVIANTENMKYKLSVVNAQPLSLSGVRRTIENFNNGGESLYHRPSAWAWCIEEYCQLNEIKYEITIGDQPAFDTIKKVETN
jgi:hypothetical protein